MVAVGTKRSSVQLSKAGVTHKEPPPQQYEGSTEAHPWMTVVT